MGMYQGGNIPYDSNHIAANIKGGIKILGVIGTYKPEPVWSAESTTTMDYTSALDYAAHLELDGITINANPQNLWRLPTMGEILTTTHVFTLGNFWTSNSSSYDPMRAFFAYGTSPDFDIEYKSESSYISVCCVLI